MTVYFTLILLRMSWGFFTDYLGREKQTRAPRLD
jgi:hypothetical protein